MPTALLNVGSTLVNKLAFPIIAVILTLWVTGKL